MSFEELPSGWISARAAEICEKIQDGIHFSPKRQSLTGEYRYITAKNVRPGGLDLSRVTFLTEHDHRTIFRRCDPRRGDVLLVKDGVNAGDAAINTLDEEISLLSSVCFLRPHPAVIDGAFLRYYLLSPVASRRLAGKLSGTAIRRIVLHRVKDLSVHVAPLAEQRRIVGAIDSCFTRLDDAVTTLERVRRNLKRYRASVLKAAVEGRLVPTEAELAHAEGREYEPASVLLDRILAERRRQWKVSGGKRKYHEPVTPEITNLPALPDGWCWASPDQLACLDDYSLGIGPFGSNLKVSD
jgi:type I restriction enzyme S subunit